MLFIIKNKEMIRMKKETKMLEITDLPGIGTTTAEKLIECGYTDVMSVATASYGELMDKAGLSKDVAKKAIDFARDNNMMTFCDAQEFEDKRKSVFHIDTGSKQLNDLLGGGIESGVITEFAGAFGSGKTQIAHQAAVNVFRDLKGITLYIDSENTFRTERIVQMKGECDSVELCKAVRVGKAYNSDHQMLLAEKVEKMIKDDKLPIKLVVIDSLTAHFRSEFIGRGTLAERQQKLNKHMRFLSKMADIHNIAVIVTNQVTTDLGVFFGDPDRPIGGHIVGHTSVFRLFCRRGKKGTRVAKIIDGPVPEGEAGYVITSTGIKDI